MKNEWIKVKGEKSLPKISCTIETRGYSQSSTLSDYPFVPMPDEAYSTNFLLKHVIEYRMLKEL